MIVHIVTQEEPGGAQQLAVRLCQAHRAAGEPAETWFLYRKQAAFAGEPGLRTLLAARPGPLGLGSLLRRLRDELLAVRPRAVVAHTHWANLLVPPQARRAGVAQRIATLHSPPAALPPVSRWVERLAARAGAATDWVAVSEAVAHGWPAALRPQVIVNGVADLPPGDGAAMRRRLGLPDEAPLLAAVGRLAIEKGHADLIALLARLPAAHAAVAGEGPLREALLGQAARAGVSGRFHLLGAQDRPGIADLLAAADIFIMPSRFEGLSLALLEAMRAGVAVVASDIAGNRDALGEGTGAAGILVPAGDIPALATAVGPLLADPLRRRELAGRACSRAAGFGEAAMVAAWHRLLGIA